MFAASPLGIPSPCEGVQKISPNEYSWRTLTPPPLTADIRLGTRDVFPYTMPRRAGPFVTRLTRHRQRQTRTYLFFLPLKLPQ